MVENDMEKSGWISVHDQLPTKDGRYLTYNLLEYYKHKEAEWNVEHSGWKHELEQKGYCKYRPYSWVSHWRHLPDPPVFERWNNYRNTGVDRKNQFDGVKL